MLETIGGIVVWALANLVYVDMKRKGAQGFQRIMAFFFGLPTTWLTFFFLEEGTQPRIAPLPDDEDGLLREIRRDRALRSGESTTGESEES